MKRRSFLGTILTVMAFLTVPVLGVLGRLLPERYVEALRSRLYPGPVTELTEADLNEPGRWGG